MAFFDLGFRFFLADNGFMENQEQVGRLPTILMVGVASKVEEMIQPILSSATTVAMSMDVEKLLEETSLIPDVVLSGPPREGVSANLLAETLRKKYPEIPIYICFTEKSGFERKLFIRSGFTDAFLVPIDSTNLNQALSDHLAQASHGTIKVQRPVKIVDLEPGQSLDFDVSVLLPMNRKYIKINSAGEPIDQDRVEKLKKHKMNNVFVPAEQMKNFYSYSAKRIKNIEGSTTMSVTERREKMATVVRELISGMFTEEASGFDAGHSILKDCGEIVKTYILDGAKNEWYARILEVMGEKGGAYTHSGNVSTLAALFSMGLGIGKPEDLAMAGLLHDIGIAELPVDLQLMDPEKMNLAQKAVYQKHPELSVNMIKSRRIIMPEIVMKMILQHHENFDGTGYPKKMTGDRICKEAQILSIANRFEELTALEPGHRMMSPNDAVQWMQQEKKFNPEILDKLMTLFTSRTEH